MTKINPSNENTKTFLASNGEYLVWNDALGYGYLPSTATDNVYDIEYWDNYQKMKQTNMGKLLTEARIKFASKYTDKNSVIDIGIGNGQFVEEFGCHGTDINPHAVQWLKDIGKYSMIENTWDWFTMWDVLEHCERETLEYMFKYNSKGVILSIPIYKNFEDCITNRHQKSNEHLHYHTLIGLINFMKEFGYEIIDLNWAESTLGRHQIASCVFVKQKFFHENVLT